MPQVPISHRAAWSRQGMSHTESIYGLFKRLLLFFFLGTLKWKSSGLKIQESLKAAHPFYEWLSIYKGVCIKRGGGVCICVDLILPLESIESVWET